LKIGALGRAAALILSGCLAVSVQGCRGSAKSKEDRASSSTAAPAIEVAKARAANPAADPALNLPMFCEDSTGEIQPMKYASFTKLAEAYKRDLGFSHKFVDRGEKRSDGEPYQVLLFSNGRDDASYEGVGYVVTRHADGLAVRLSHAQFAGRPLEKTSGTDMCMLIMLISMKGFPKDLSSEKPAHQPAADVSEQSPPTPPSERTIALREAAAEQRRYEEERRLQRIRDHQERVRCYVHGSPPC